MASTLFEHDKVDSSNQKNFRARDTVECSNIFLSAGNDPRYLECGVLDCCWNSTVVGSTWIQNSTQGPEIIEKGNTKLANLEIKPTKIFRVLVP